MNNIEQIDEEFKQLFANYFTGEITKEELEKLTRWINASKLNKEYFEQFEAAWVLANNPERENTPVAEIRDNLQLKLQEDQGPKRKSFVSFLRVAAIWTLIFSLGVSVHWFLTKNNFPDKSKFVEIQAPLGSKSYVALPDGSNVWLNAGSKISYYNDFNLKQRKIHLSGEAYFDVATNKAKPFIVITDKIVVRAFGTRFNVKSYPNEKTITTTLEEGKIDVSVINDKKFKDAIVLLPRQNIVYYRESKGIVVVKKQYEKKRNNDEYAVNKSPDEPKIELIENVKTELFTSWKEKRWVIDAITLDEFVPMIERRYNLKIAFKDAEIKNYKFSGIIQNETVEQIMDALKYTAPVDYSIKKDSIYLSTNQELKKEYEYIIKTRK